MLEVVAVFLGLWWYDIDVGGCGGDLGVVVVDIDVGGCGGHLGVLMV